METTPIPAGPEMILVESEFEAAVSLACGLVGHSPDVTAVHVLGGGRPSFDAVWRMRMMSEAHGVRLHVDGTGQVDIHPLGVQANPAPPIPRDSTGRRAVGRRLARLRADGKGWGPGFRGLTEGTR